MCSCMCWVSKAHQLCMRPYIKMCANPFAYGKSISVCVSALACACACSQACL